MPRCISKYHGYNRENLKAEDNQLVEFIAENQCWSLQEYFAPASCQQAILLH
jgi:hypothetical protein